MMAILCEGSSRKAKDRHTAELEAVADGVSAVADSVPEILELDIFFSPFFPASKCQKEVLGDSKAPGTGSRNDG